MNELRTSEMIPKYFASAVKYYAMKKGWRCKIKLKRLTVLISDNQKVEPKLIKSEMKIGTF